MKNRPVLRYYKLFPDVFEPKFGTERSACFDLHAHFTGKAESVRIIDKFNDETRVTPLPGVDGRRSIQVHPGCRVLVPTGLIFCIPEGYSVRVFSRSSVGIRTGLPIAHGVGVIDSDYFHETFAALLNITNETLVVTHGDRVAQAELVELPKYDLEETTEEPSQITSRAGGFGSTGR